MDTLKKLWKQAKKKYIINVIHQKQCRKIVRDSKEDMMKVMLTNKDEYPTDEILQQCFSETEYELYRQLVDGLHKNDLQEQWNYYRDGKSWLGKIMFKKKNLGWISYLETGLQVGVYFGERIWPQVFDLDLDERIKSRLPQIEKSGKLYGVIIPITDEAYVKAALSLVLFKKGAK